MAATLKLKLDEGFAWVWLEDTKGINTMGLQFMESLMDIVEELESHKKVRGAVFATESTHFSVGLDFKEVVGGKPEDVIKIAQKATKVFNGLADLPFPTLALFRGYTVGGAIEMTAGCDFRIAAEDTKISIPATKIGFFNPAGTAFRLPRLIGLPRAKELMIMSKTIDAQTAKDWGLVNEVVKTSELISAGQAWCRQVLELEPQAVKSTKHLLDISFENGIEAFTKIEGKELKSCLNRPEPLELMKNFWKK